MEKSVVMLWVWRARFRFRLQKFVGVEMEVWSKHSAMLSQNPG